jgi:hypothetical protein
MMWPLLYLGFIVVGSTTFGVLASRRAKRRDPFGMSTDPMPAHSEYNARFLTTPAANPATRKVCSGTSTISVNKVTPHTATPCAGSTPATEHVVCRRAVRIARG